MSKSEIVNKLWSICDILRAEGMHISTYIEQVTALLFLKLFDEKIKNEDNSNFIDKTKIPEGCSWEDLVEFCKNEKTVIDNYTDIIRELGKQEGILGEIFGRVNNAFRTPKSLVKAVTEMDKVEWDSYDTDVKGDAYEGLLEKYAKEAKGAGQYFTPRHAIEAMVEVLDPKYNETIHDPASGTGGFLISAHNYILHKTNYLSGLSSDDKKKFRKHTFSGGELVAETRRLALMNLMLHGIEPSSEDFYVGDSLTTKHAEKKFDVILTNPPFGGRVSEAPSRDDFVIKNIKSTEINFLQHLMSISKAKTGRVATVIPEGILFQDGAAKRLRERLIDKFNLHTVLILPKNSFAPYATIDTAILFFDKTKKTEEIWFYDLRTGIESRNKSRTLNKELFEDFVKNYNSRESSKKYIKVDLKKVLDNDYNLDPKLYGIGKEDSIEEEIPEPHELIKEIKEKVDSFKSLLDDIEKEIKNE